jgi:hypothetical protein
MYDWHPITNQTVWTELPGRPCHPAAEPGVGGRRVDGRGAISGGAGAGAGAAARPGLYGAVSVVVASLHADFKLTYYCNSHSTDPKNNRPTAFSRAEAAIQSGAVRQLAADLRAQLGQLVRTDYTGHAVLQAKKQVCLGV